MDNRLDQQQKIVQRLISSFSGRKKPEVRLIAYKMLEDIFSSCGYSLKHFFFTYSITSKEKDRFLSHLLYGIYYHSIFIPSLPKEEAFLKYYLFTLFAECVGNKNISRSLLAIDEVQALHLLNHCYRYPNVGAYKILGLFKQIYFQNPLWQRLLDGMQNKYFDPDTLQKCIANSKHDLKTILKALEQNSHQEVKKLKIQIESLLNALKKANNKKGLPFALIKQFYPLFAPYVVMYSENELNDFFEIFGLYGHVIAGADCTMGAKLLDHLKQIEEMIENPMFISPHHFQATIHFVLSLLQALHTFTHRPAIYLKGLCNTVFAMPTKGKKTSELSWIASVLEGISSLIHILLLKNCPCNPSTCPIVIFDQSKEPLFRSHKKYIQTLQKRFSFPIWHLSSEKTLTLAKKLNVDCWIATDNQSFGYGGARNAIFFLAPLIHLAAEKGIKDIDELLAVDLSDLTQMFKKSVLGISGKDKVIHMGEDDISIPLCNIFSDLFVAATCQDQYFQSRSFFLGRGSHLLFPGIDQKSYENDPFDLYASTIWSNQILNAGMLALVTKPIFCFPLPFGNEETHVYLKQIPCPFKQPIIHFGSLHYPKTLYPKTPFEGALKYLLAYIPYFFGVILSSHLIDPQNKRNASLTPWNQTLYCNSKITCLNDLFNFISQKEQLLHIENQFWKNLKSEFSDTSHSADTLVNFLIKFINTEEKSALPYAMQSYYKDLKTDAKNACAALQNLLKAKEQNPNLSLKSALLPFKCDIDPQKNPFTHAIFTMIKGISALCSQLKPKNGSWRR